METTDISPEPPPVPLPFDCSPPTKEELDSLITTHYGLIVAGCTKFWRQFKQLGYTVDDLVGDMVIHIYHIREKFDPEKVINSKNKPTNRKEALRRAFCALVPCAINNKLINDLRNKSRPGRDLIYSQKGDGEVEDKINRIKNRELAPVDQLIIKEAFGTTDEIAEKLIRREKEIIEKYPHQLHTDKHGSVQAVIILRHVLKTKRHNQDPEMLAAFLGVLENYVVEVFKLLKRFKHIPLLKDRVNEVLQLKPTWLWEFHGITAADWRKAREQLKGKLKVEQTPIVQDPEQLTKKKPPSIEQYLERNPPREGEPVDAETVAAVCETNLGYTKKTISILGFYHKTSPKYLRMLKAKNKSAGSPDTKEPKRRSSPEPIEPVKKKRRRRRTTRKVEKPTPIVFTKPIKKPGKRGSKGKKPTWIERTRSFVLGLFGMGSGK